VQQPVVVCVLQCDRTRSCNDARERKGSNMNAAVVIQLMYVTGLVRETNTFVKWKGRTRSCDGRKAT